MNDGSITGDEAFQIMLTSLTYELIAAARAVDMSDTVILAGLQTCLDDALSSAVGSGVSH